jgi:hypothetical protein
MWKLLIMVFIMNDAGQVEQVSGEHQLTFSSAQDCYEAAADLYRDTHDAVQGISIMCVKEQERQA